VPASAARGKRNARRRARDGAYRRFGPDSSTVVYTFDDGWSIRRLQTPDDERIEGALLHHCLGWREDRCEFENLHSLRDIDNYPRATFQHFGPEHFDQAWLPGGPLTHGCTLALEGHGAVKPVKVDYVRRIARWHATLPYPVEIDDELLREETARLAPAAAVR
jgi:hypothetical protein